MVDIVITYRKLRRYVILSTFSALLTLVILGFLEYKVQSLVPSPIGRKWIETSSFNGAFSANYKHDLGNFVALPVGEYIYVIGGSVESSTDIWDGEPTDIVLRARVTEQQELTNWSQVYSENLPKIEYLAGTSSISNCIYLVGGNGTIQEGTPQNWVFRSKPDGVGSLYWYSSTLGNNFVGRNQLAVANSGNRIFVLGGWAGSPNVLGAVLYQVSDAGNVLLIEQKLGHPQNPD